jgi:ketosteroid isomerase-like protein
MKQRILPITLLLVICGAVPAAHHEEAAIGGVLDDFHDAAAKGDKARYLGHMTDDAVFMGTDEWERWPKQPDFTDYVTGRFRDGAGWSYRPVARQISVAESGDVAWFDEVVYSETNGRFRGTGVLVRQDGTWKIAHYAMSFLIFNENWQDVIELTKRTREQKALNRGDAE